MADDFSAKLRGFEEVWKRVQKAGEKKAPPPLMPGKQAKSCAIRYNPHQRRG